MQAIGELHEWRARLQPCEQTLQEALPAFEAVIEERYAGNDPGKRFVIAKHAVKIERIAADQSDAGKALCNEAREFWIVFDGRDLVRRNAAFNEGLGGDAGSRTNLEDGDLCRHLGGDGVGESAA